MISVVIPAFNEVEAVNGTILQIKTVLTDFQHEILVVDDGSDDSTAEVARDAGAKVVKHPQNMGYGAAIKTGINAASYDTIVITDADGTYPNDKIPALVHEFQSGFNMVVGARTGSHYWDTALKTPLRLILKWLVEFTTGRKIADINSGFRVFSKDDIIPYYNHLCDTFSFTTSLTLAYMMTSKFVGYMPINYEKRIGRSKVRLFRDSLRTLQYILRAVLYYNPLKIYLLMCGFISAGSIVLLGLASVFHIVSAFYLGVGGVLMAIHVFCLGLLAELLRQIMVKN